MSAWTIYFILMLDNINLALTVFFVISLGISGGAFMLYSEADISINPVLFFFSLSFLLFLIMCFLPTTKQAAMIYVIPKISNSELARQLPDKLLKLATKEFDKIVGENESKD